MTECKYILDASHLPNLFPVSFTYFFILTFTVSAQFLSGFIHILFPSFFLGPVSFFHKYLSSSSLLFRGFFECNYKILRLVAMSPLAPLPIRPIFRPILNNFWDNCNRQIHELFRPD